MSENSNYNRIISILSELNINYDQIDHNISKSCEDSKKFREEKWLTGLWSKNIIFSAKNNFYLVTTHWDKNIKARNFKKEFFTKDIRFAYQDEITNIINATIWSIPPFGFDNNLLSIYVDWEIFENEYFIFNPSVSTKSIRIRTQDLKNIYRNLKNPIKYFIHKEDDFQIFDEL